MLTLLSLYTLLVPLILATSYENVNSRNFWYHDAAELILVSIDHLIAHVFKRSVISRSDKFRFSANQQLCTSFTTTLQFEKSGLKTVAKKITMDTCIVKKGSNKRCINE